MPVPETSRQYLPDLETRWQLSRRKILELARDGKLPLWIEFWDVFLEDSSGKEEWADYIELKFFLGSLRQLCANVEIGDIWQPCLHNSQGEPISGTNGILRDGRRVLVWRKAKPTNKRSVSNPRNFLWVKYSEVFADLDDVKRLDNEFLHDVGGQSQRPPYLDPEHKYYSEELHSPQKDVEQRQKDLSPTREKTLLKMIGALLAMRYRGPDFEKSNGDPNVSRIAESVQQDMASAAIDDYGLKDRTLRELIPKAMEAIAENRG